MPLVKDARRDALALAYPDLDKFDDPKLEWRRLFSELLGTFFLVLVAAGGGWRMSITRIPAPTPVPVGTTSMTILRLMRGFYDNNLHRAGRLSKSK